MTNVAPRLKEKQRDIQEQDITETERINVGGTNHNQRFPLQPRNKPKEAKNSARQKPKQKEHKLVCQTGVHSAQISEGGRTPGP